MATALTLPARIRRIHQRRAVLKRMIRTSLSLRYEATTLGYAWTLLEPLAMTFVYVVVFGFVGRFGRVQPFAPFILSGVLAWQWFSGSFNSSMRALRGNSKLIGKVDLPREIYPIEVVLRKGIEFVISLVVLVAFALAYGLRPSPMIAAFPLAMLLQLMLTMGFALGLAACATLVRDIEKVARPLLRTWFYMSPILYPMIMLDDQVGPTFEFIYRLNPMTGILTLYRAAWTGWVRNDTKEAISQFDSWATVGYSAIGCLLVLFIGYRLFTRLEPRVLKEL